MFRRITLISLLLFSNVATNPVFACSFEDTNGDTLILSTGLASIVGNSLLNLSGITFNNDVYDNVPVNLDIENLRWSFTPPYPSAGLLDLTTASAILTGDNDIRFEKITYAGVFYNVTIILNIDGTISGKDLSEWQEGSSEESSIADFGSWIGSGGLDETSENNPRFTLNLCDTRSIRIELDSEVDNYLYLLDEQGNIVAENDDRDIAGGNRNAALDITLARGIYTIVVATYSAGETDIFDISVSPDPENPAPNALTGALNLLAIPGTDFVDYASLGGQVSNTQTGEPIVGAEIDVFGFIAGFANVTVFSNSDGNYFLRVFADRLFAGNRFDARASSQGCTPSIDQFGFVDAENHASINFTLEDCLAPDDLADDSNPTSDSNDGEDLASSLTIETASCTAVRFSFGTIQFNEINITGTASGPVGARVTGTVDLNCSAWSNCERQTGEPESTAWTDYSTTTTASPQSWTTTLQGTGDPTSAITTFDCPTA